MCYEEIGRYLNFQLWDRLNLYTHSIPLLRLREAIECLKRALIGADPFETSINLKLAKLHNDLEEWTESSHVQANITIRNECPGIRNASSSVLSTSVT